MMANEKISKESVNFMVREITQEAWKSLLEGPEEIIRDLLAETVEQKWGIKPENKTIEDFLREQVTTLQESNEEVPEQGQIDISIGPEISPKESAEFSPVGKINLMPDELNKLAFTRLIEVKIGEKVIEANSWNQLYQRFLVLTLDSGHSLEKLKSFTHANLIHGEKRTEGFKFVPSHNFSFQNESAPKIARYLRIISEILEKKTQIDFVWKYNDKASNPGIPGRLNFD